MLKVRVIPCLDVHGGRVVKGVRFVDLRDAGDPAACAGAYDAAGADEICFLDISATHESRPTLLDAVERTADACRMPITVGGGVRKLEDIRDLMLAGADKVAVNSAALATPHLISEAAGRFGSQAIVAALDARLATDDAPSGYTLWTHGGKKDSGIDALEFSIQISRMGCGEILLTSMDRDGTRSGFDLALTRRIADAVPVPLIASGGAGTCEHLIDGVRLGHASAVLAASIFHFGILGIGQVKHAMAKAGIPVRREPIVSHAC